MGVREGAAVHLLLFFISPFLVTVCLLRCLLLTTAAAPAPGGKKGGDKKPAEPKAKAAVTPAAGAPAPAADAAAPAEGAKKGGACVVVALRLGRTASLEGRVVCTLCPAFFPLRLLSRSSKRFCGIAIGAW